MGELSLWKTIALLLVLAFLVVSCIVVVKFAPSADSFDLAESIIIKEDGSIEGTDEIQRVGDVYTFVGDVGFSSGYPNAGIKVLKDNMVIDGAHFSIYANDNVSNGIDLSGRNNVEVKNLEIRGFQHGVYLDKASNNTISGNEIFSGNDSRYAPTGGITLINSVNSIITNNHVDKCGTGIFLRHCQNVSVTGNSVTRSFELGIGPIDCYNITIAMNNIDSCMFGIATGGTYRRGYAHQSTNMTICRNNITRCDPGIGLTASSKNLISNNYIANNRKGINAISSDQNIITENTFVENNEGAVRLSGSQRNKFYHNNFIDNNASGIQISNPWLVKGNPEDNFWDDDVQGNYWNDLKQRYPNATEIPGLGVWDTPYYINPKNIDRYPLVASFVPPQPSFILDTTLPDSKPSESPPAGFLITITVMSITISAAIIGIGLLAYFKKRGR